MTFPSYKFDSGGPKKRKFFSKKNAVKWTFESFIRAYPEDTIKTNLMDYLNCLHWVKKQYIDDKLRVHVEALLKEWKKPTNKKLNAAKKLLETATIKSSIGILSVEGNNNNVTQTINLKRPHSDGADCDSSDVDDGRIEKKAHVSDEDFTDEPSSLELGPNEVQGEEEEDVEVISLWSAWRKYVEEYENENPNNIYKPELYGVLWCGAGVKKRDPIPEDLYNGIQGQVVSNNKPSIYTCLEDDIDNVLNAGTVEVMEMLVVGLPVTIVDRLLKNKVIFIQDLFVTFAKDVYTGIVDVTKSESSWNDGVLWPLMKACARYIRLSRGITITFIPGETGLKAMTNIGVATTNAPYLADGILQLTSMDDIELCFLETSNAFDQAGKAKISFDHHKAMFALLSMVRNMANEYQYASYEDIKEMKFHFIHAHGGTIRVWSMSTPEKDVYLMTKEIRMPAPRNFSKKADQLYRFLGAGNWW